VVEDDATNPARAVTATQKLISINHVQAIVGGTWDFLLEASAPLAARAGIPYFSMTNPVEVLSPRLLELPLLFTNALSLKKTGAALGTFLDAMKPKSVGIFAPEFPFTQKHADLVEKLCQERAIAVAIRPHFSYDDFYSSVRALGAKAARGNLDLVFVFTSAEGLEPFLASYRSQGGQGKFVTAQHLDNALATTSRGDRDIRVADHGASTRRQ
jgi:ABC-type branched-subunit amino acid transport system substrate-binding protein